MNGRIESKPVKPVETADTFHGFSRCGQGRWTNGDVIVVPAYKDGVRIGMSVYRGDTRLGMSPSLVDAINAYVGGKVG